MSDDKYKILCAASREALVRYIVVAQQQAKGIRRLHRLINRLRAQNAELKIELESRHNAEITNLNEERERATKAEQLWFHHSEAREKAVRERNEAINLLKNLAKGLDSAYISTWQSTSAWKRQLNEALCFLANLDNDAK